MATKPSGAVTLYPFEVLMKVPIFSALFSFCNTIAETSGGAYPFPHILTCASPLVCLVTLKGSNFVSDLTVLSVNFLSLNGGDIWYLYGRCYGILKLQILELK